MTGLRVEDAFAVFDQQNSGSLSYGIERAGRRWFVKTAGGPQTAAALRRVVELHRAVRHEAIVRPVAVTAGPTLVYPWCPGDVLNAATVHGSDRTALDRFRRLPSGVRRRAVAAVLDAHRAIAAAGWVSVDLYDGCFLWDGATATMRLIDLDDYRPGPFLLEAERLPGSTRYMAPEEWTRGARIDERTTVHHLGRVVEQLLGPDELVARATAADPAARYPTVAALVAAFR